MFWVLYDAGRKSRDLKKEKRRKCYIQANESSRQLGVGQIEDLEIEIDCKVEE